MATVESDQSVYVGVHLLAVCNHVGIYESEIETALMIGDCDQPTLERLLVELEESDIISGWNVTDDRVIIEFRM